MPPIEIFRPGRHVAMSGQAISFSAADLAATAAAYSPSVHEAPFCVGHPADDAPAYGWVKGLSFADGALQADPDQIDPAFAELVKAGRFKKISAAFYPPDSASNPKPGVYYLRHVAFLGAQPPAVKGLKPVQFAGAAGAALVFGDVDDGVVIRLLRGLRDALISRWGQDAADAALPPDVLNDLADDAAQPDDDTPDDEDAMTQTAFAEQQRQLEARQREIEERERKLADREKGVTSKEALFAEEEAKQRAAANTAFLDGLIKQGRILPAWRPALIGLLAFADKHGADVLTFGEGRERKEIAPGDALRQLLSVLPKQVEFGEVARTPVEKAASSVPGLALPPGFKIDEQQMELRNRALAYAEEHKIDFLEAVRRLEHAV